MTIRSRYLSYLALILGAGFLAVGTQAFAPVAVAWLTFAIAVGAAVVGMWLIISPGIRPWAEDLENDGSTTVYHRVLGGLVCALSAWTIIASLVFAPTTALWLGLASAIAYIVLGVVGLTIHEVRAERVVLELRPTSDEVPPVEAGV